MRAWHFMADKDGKPVLRDGRPAPRVGCWLKHDGHLEMCKTGLHASKRIMDALQFAPGPWVAMVECEGDIQEQSDKLICRRRKILKLANVERILHEFAVCCAVMALEKAEVTDERCWQAIDIKLAWLEGMATDEDLADARAATWDARAAARDATWDAARAAAWGAAWNAARAAAWADARAATWDATWDTARDAEDKLLTDMVMAEFGKPSPSSGEKEGA